MKKIAGVYKITNVVNGKFYIGSSVDIRNRWSVHKMRLRKQKHSNPILQNAWNIYGAENFKFEIVEQVEIREDAVIREQYYLDVLQPVYNVVKRAEATNLGRKLSKKARENIRRSKLGVYDGENNPFYGKNHSEETKRKLSKLHTGMKQSVETIKKKADALRGEKSHYAKLTWDEVREIRRLFEEENWTENMLIDKFGMSQSAINKIVKYKTWRLK